MNEITVSESKQNYTNITYIKNTMNELISHTGSRIDIKEKDGRIVLSITCDPTYIDIIRAELTDRIAEIIAINYKNNFFKNQIKTCGLKKCEREILLTSLIAADLQTDKQYCYDKCKELEEFAIDGTFNFILSPLKKKWAEIVSYMPTCFLPDQLKDFISFLIEHKKKRVYVDNGKVYDSHYRKLTRCDLLDGEEVKLTREILLSNCGEVELSGVLPKEDEYYLKEYYGDKIIFSSKNY